jgi:DNA-binding GntR family transcriptional regulator
VAEPQKGFRVAPISKEDLIDLSKTRAKIEAICLQEAVERGDVTWETQVLAAHHFLARTPMKRANDPALLSKEWDIRHNDFHIALASGCGSPTLMRIRQGLFEQSERYRFLSIPFDHGKRNVAAEHQAICDAALKRDREAVTQLITKHIERTTQIILNGMETWAQSEDAVEPKSLPAVRVKRANGSRKPYKRKRDISVEIGR